MFTREKERLPVLLRKGVRRAHRLTKERQLPEVPPGFNPPAHLLANADRDLPADDDVEPVDLVPALNQRVTRAELTHINVANHPQQLRHVELIKELHVPQQLHLIKRISAGRVPLKI